jgi:hypothetical protein
MRSVEAGNEKIRKCERPRGRLGEGLTIEFCDETQAAGAKMLAEAMNDRLERIQLKRVKIPAGYFQPVECSQKVVRCAHDRFCRELGCICFCISRSGERLFRRNREE